MNISNRVAKALRILVISFLNQSLRISVVEVTPELGQKNLLLIAFYTKQIWIVVIDRY